MKRYKLSSTLHFVSAVLFFFAAIVQYAGGTDNSMAVVWLGLGFTYLCLGTMDSKKAKKKQSKED